MDSIALILAFVLGFAARQIGLPPLVGYLVAGHPKASEMANARFDDEVTALKEAGVQAYNFF